MATSSCVRGAAEQARLLLYRSRFKGGFVSVIMPCRCAKSALCVVLVKAAHCHDERCSCIQSPISCCHSKRRGEPRWEGSSTHS
eukprot:2058964-Pleurochrysis_carterae.AAC.3